MSDHAVAPTALPSTARAVVIGAGIVGCSVAYHLTRLGWNGVVLLDKGPLPDPGGSTGHASNFIFPVDHSREVTQLTLESVRQYEELGVFTASGGIEVARTEERLEELRRRLASAVSWGVEPASLVTPAEVKELVPYVEESVIVGGFYTPSVGVVDSLRAGTIMRERGQAAGALGVVREHRDPRPRRRARADPARSHDARRHRGRDGGDRLRRLEPAGRPARRGVDPAHPGGASDDRGRPGAAVCRCVDGASSSRSFATWTQACTSGSTEPASRSARTRTGRSSGSPTRFPRARTRRSPRPSCPSRRRTSSRSSSTRASSSRRSSATSRSASGTRSTACSRSPRTASRSSARHPRCAASGRRRRSGSRRGRVSARRWPSG